MIAGNATQGFLAASQKPGTPPVVFVVVNSLDIDQHIKLQILKGWNGINNVPKWDVHFEARAILLIRDERADCASSVICPAVQAEAIVTS